MISVERTYNFESDDEAHTNGGDLSELSDVYDDDDAITVSSNISYMNSNVANMLSIDDIPFERDLKLINAPSNEKKLILFKPSRPSDNSKKGLKDLSEKPDRHFHKFDDKRKDFHNSSINKFDPEYHPKNKYNSHHFKSDKDMHNREMFNHATPKHPKGAFKSSAPHMKSLHENSNDINNFGNYHNVSNTYYMTNYPNTQQQTPQSMGYPHPRQHNSQYLQQNFQPSPRSQSQASYYPYLSDNLPQFEDLNYLPQPNPHSTSSQSFHMNTPALSQSNNSNHMYSAPYPHLNPNAQDFVPSFGFR